MNPKTSSRSASPARRRAFDILRRVESERAYASVLLAAADSGLSREDRTLAQEIVLGVLRWQKTLDYFIERYSERPISRLDLSVLIALRIGLYQLRYLTRVPQSAAVNESVNLVKRARAVSAGGLVNAVLRKAAGNLADKAGEGIDDSLDRSSIELSHPRWMLKRWQSDLGVEASQRLALANNEPATTAFRINTLRTTIAQTITQLGAEGVITRESEVAPGAYIVESGPVLPIAEAARHGLIYVQDQASQLVSILLESGEGHRILDLCAAPGSKASQIAVLTGNKAWIIACDRHPHRLHSLRATGERLGIDSVDVIALDATKPLPFEGAMTFDRVLLDAPCSGTGTLRGNPEIKWRLSEDDIPRLAELQLSLISRAALSVACNGRLVYSTCSIEREENELVIDRFLKSGAPFRIVHPAASAGVISSEGFVRTFPHIHGTDGFFAAVLEKVR